MLSLCIFFTYSFWNSPKGFGYGRLLAWLVPLKKEISQQNWEVNDNKVKLMLSQFSVIPGFLQGREELACET